MVKVFVYGTLKKGFGLHTMLGKDSVFISDYTLRDYTLFDVGCNSFPLAVPKYNSIVKGELYEVSNEAMVNMDAIEINSGYIKEKDGDVYFYRYLSTYDMLKQKGYKHIGEEFKER